MDLANHSKQAYFPENQFDCTEEIRSNKQLLGLIMGIRSALHRKCTQDENLINSYFNVMVLFLNYMGLYYKPSFLKRLWADKSRQLNDDHGYFKGLVGIDIKKEFKEVMVDLSQQRTTTKHFSIEYNFRFFEVLLNYNEPEFTQEQIQLIVKELKPFIVFSELQLTHLVEHENGMVTDPMIEPEVFNTLTEEEKDIYVKNNGEYVAMRYKYGWQAYLYLLHGYLVEIEVEDQKTVSVKLLKKEDIKFYYEHLDKIKEQVN